MNRPTTNSGPVWQELSKAESSLQASTIVLVLCLFCSQGLFLLCMSWYVFDLARISNTQMGLVCVRMSKGNMKRWRLLFYVSLEVAESQQRSELTLNGVTNSNTKVPIENMSVITKKKGSNGVTT